MSSFPVQDSANFQGIYLQKTLLEEVLLPPNSASGASQRKISYSYDDANRLTEIKQQINGSGTQELRLKSAYSAFSQLKALTRIKNGFERSYLFSYDQLGRQIAVADPLATPGVTTQSYEPFCVGFATTTARGVRRRVNFDNRCLPTLLEAGDIDPNDNLEVLNTRRTKEWQHDELGRLISSVGSRPGRYNQAIPLSQDLDSRDGRGGVAVARRTERLIPCVFE